MKNNENVLFLKRRRALVSSDLLRRSSTAKKKELEGVESKLREKKESKKRSREVQGAPEDLQSHDPLSLCSDSDLPRSYESHRPSVGGAATEPKRSSERPTRARQRPR